MTSPSAWVSYGGTASSKALHARCERRRIKFQLGTISSAQSIPDFMIVCSQCHSENFVNDHSARQLEPVTDVTD
jgi:hypothetical protein